MRLAARTSGTAAILALAWASSCQTQSASPESASERLSEVRRKHIVPLEEELQLARAAPEGREKELELLIAIAKAYAEEGAYISGEDILEDALVLAKSVHGDRSLETGRVLDLQATLLGLQGSHVEAVDRARSARAAIEAAFGGEHRAAAFASYKLGNALLRCGMTSEAEELLLPALERLTEEHGGASHEILNLQEAVAELFLSTGRVVEAHGLLQYTATVRSEALEFSEDESKARLYQVPSQILLGELYSRIGLQEEADSVLREALASLESGLSPGHPRLERVLVDLAATHERRGDGEAAERILERARGVHAANVGFAFGDAAVLPTPVPELRIDADPTAAFAFVREGDWAVMGVGDEPMERLEVQRVTPSVVAMSRSMWDPDGATWREVEQLLARGDSSLVEHYELGELSLLEEEIELRGSTVTCLTAEIRDEEGVVTKLYFAPGVVHASPFVRVEVDGEVELEVLDFGRGDRGAPER